MHEEARAAIHRMAYGSTMNTSPPLPDDMRCLDLGGRSSNGSAREIILGGTWDVLDIEPGNDVTVVADARFWRGDHDYALVTCTEVLEHVEQWGKIVAACWSALAPDGELILTCASTDRPPHGALGGGIEPGEYYGNVEPNALGIELRKWFDNVEVWYLYPPGDAYARATRPKSGQPGW